ncbi:hypothetical protein DPEC_G00032320 [Dallia pectoralis]|uniref:Uncharacterized protein n=1 Tax=Dallia pectoralis TaxID=75939 RepID=A0ACC2HCL6_DALPE|nr:hypothetical protein DPEC_G00032320 [Dallia pectoralis]
MAPLGLMSAGVSLLTKSFSLFSNVYSLARRCVSVLPAVKTFSTNLGLPPKRPANAYMRYVKQQHPLYVKQNPDLPNADVIKRIAQHWRELSPEQKQPFEQEFIMARAQFKVDRQRFEAHLTPAQLTALKEERQQRLLDKNTRRRKLALNKLGKPKGPRSGYNIYFSEKYNEIKGTSMTNKMSMLSAGWRTLPVSEKQMYNHLSQDDMVRYRNEMKFWEEQMSEMGREDLISQKKSPKKTVPTTKTASI